MHLTDNTILITGGTSGIGRGLAEALHARGNKVIIAGRRQALLEEITAANPGMRGVQLDLQDPAAIDAFAATAKADFPELNVLINNAGISKPEDLNSGSSDISTAQSIIDTNIVSVIHLTATLLPQLKSQASSTIITTTSGLGFLPSAGYPTYSASKAFLHSWLQSLRFQLRDTSVEVLELPPPYVQTELTGTSQLSDPNAMPLEGYIAEVMDLLENSDYPNGEILVDRVKELRFAERNGVYDQVYDTYHSR
ncbi:SDR family NAD(P)-dependent oxidoreductase [bacterium]|nr:MAG: SDR family NAD(P)-dependent oxidoreductase [bacterium]